MRAEAPPAAAERDTPRAAMSLLPARVTTVCVAILVGLSAAAWYGTVRQARGMGPMGLVQVGSGMGDKLAAPIFLGMWVTMMVAMMFPTVAPMVLAHRMVVRKRGEGNLPTAAFVLGYLAVWSVAGLVPLAVILGFRHVSSMAVGSRWLPTTAGAILVVAGLYQFTPWKGRCLRACRSPLTFLMTHDFRTGARGAFRAGVSHGGWCLGCCWALMAVLVVVGVMNLVWMAAIALVFLAEKNWRHGVGLTKLAGSAIFALGAAIVARPNVLIWISGGRSM